jgi:hypothetical protein
MIDQGLIDFLKKHGIFWDSACGGISVGAAYNCANPIVPGTTARLLLGNLGDISAVTYNGTLTTLIEGITMKSTKRCWVFEGIRQSLAPSYELVPGAVSVGYMHMVNFLAFDITQAAKDNYEKMSLGKMFAIVENKNAIGNGNSVFEVYGLNVGLEANSIVRNVNDQESGGAFNISLQTPDGEGKEPKMPQSWWLTNYATTKALVDGLLTPA